MNTYFEGGVDIEWFQDYCSLSEHAESTWIKLSKQIIFNKKFTRSLTYITPRSNVKLFYSFNIQNRKTLLFILKR